MRDLGFILAAFVAASLGTHAAIGLLGVPLKAWALLVTVGAAGLLAGVIVLLGEPPIEDGWKAAIVAILGSILWAQTPKAAFLALAGFLGAGVGVLFNQVNRLLAASAARGAPGKGGG